MSIGQVSSEFGVTLRTLRFYEELGLLNPSRQGLRRLYSKRDRTALQIIAVGRRLGFSLREIGRLMRARTKQADEAMDIFSLLDIETIEEQMAELEKQKGVVNASLAELKTAQERLDGLSDPSAQPWSRICLMSKRDLPDLP